jgi:hypothetical protein
VKPHPGAPEIAEEALVGDHVGRVADKTPVIATATSAVDCASAPCAILHATAMETAPKVSSTSPLTRNCRCLASFE